jgi:hypothetical protein
MYYVKQDLKKLHANLSLWLMILFTASFQKKKIFIIM